jgi:anti-anti-sigma factor
MRATLHRSDRGELVVLKAAGRMTIDSAGEEELLKPVIDRALEQGRRLFILDAAELTYIDSAGLGELARAHTRITGQRGRILFVVPLEHHLRARLRLTKLDRELRLSTTVDDAAAILQNETV